MEHELKNITEKLEQISDAFYEQKESIDLLKDTLDRASEFLKSIALSLEGILACMPKGG